MKEFFAHTLPERVKGNLKWLFIEALKKYTSFWLLCAMLFSGITVAGGYVLIFRTSPYSIYGGAVIIMGILAMLCFIGMLLAPLPEENN